MSNLRGGEFYYDALGQSGPYRHCHDTADLIFSCRNADGVEARIYQGGYMRANDIQYMQELRIGLVVNCTSNIERPPWHGQSDAPNWIRFPIAGAIFDATRHGVPILPYFRRFHTVVSNAIQAGNNIFIHCRAGAHRAGTCTAAYALMAFDLTPRQAVREVSKQRRVTQVTGDNFHLLLTLYKELQDQASAPQAAPAASSAASSAAEVASSAAAPAAPAASSAASSATPSAAFSAASSAAEVASSAAAPAAPAASSAEAGSGLSSAVAAPEAAAGLSSAVAAAAPEAAAGSSSAVAATTAASQADWEMLEKPPSEDESDPPAPPANEPPQLLLASEGIPATGTFQLMPIKEGEADHKYASVTVSSTNFTAEDLAAQESADEAPTAAPAAPTRMSHAEAVGRLLFMSWNAGGGARKLPNVLDELGYHVFAIQEAHVDQMRQMNNHNWVLEQEQCIATRKPNRVQTVGHGFIPGKIWWHVAEIFFEKPRLGLTTLVIMSLHLNNVHAKKSVVGPHSLQQAIDAALKACQDAGRPGLDIVCGDINMARPLLARAIGRSSGSLEKWRSAV